MLINKSIYFVHIPRTGGRYVKELIKFNNHICVLGDYVQWNNKEVSHLCFPDYEVFLNFLECQKFTVVRDPVDRFVSGINSDVRLNEKTINKMLKSQESLNQYLNNIIYNDLSNRYLPQINFLNKDIKIYKYEEGFEENFFKWSLNNLQLKLEQSPEIILRRNEIDISNKQKQYVENYYYKDYKLLKY